MDCLSKQSKDVQKSSKVKETKQCEMSEQRCNRYTRFFKTAGIATLLATTGMRGVESRQLQEPESLAQKNVTRPFDPPGFTDYLRKIGTSESAIRDIQRRVLVEQRRKLVVGDPLKCLDVSASQVTGSIVSSQPDTNLPGVMEQLTYSLDVRNGCPLPVDNVVYSVEQTSTCPPPTPGPDTREFTYVGDPFLVGISEHSGMLGPKNTFAGCRNIVDGIPVSSDLPDTVTVTVEATGEIPGTVPGTVDLVSSQKKVISVTRG